MAQTIIGYHIPYLRHENPISIYFDDQEQKDEYFNNVFFKQVLSDDTNASLNLMKNPYHLENTLTWFSGTRNRLLYNYFKVTDSNGDFYYFVTNWEELGSGQVRYSLKLDTVMTYLSRDHDFVRLDNRPHIVLREHKDRWLNNSTKTPKIDRTIEEIDISPESTKVTQNVHNGAAGRIRLALRHRQITASKAAYIWELYTEQSVNITNNEGIKLIGEGGMAFTGTDIKFRYGNAVATVSPPSTHYARINLAPNGTSPFTVMDSVSLYDITSGSRMTGDISPYVTVTPGPPADILGGFVEAFWFSNAVNHNIHVESNTAGNKIYTGGPTNASTSAPLADFEEFGTVTYGPIPTRTFEQLDTTDPIYSQIKELPIMPKFSGDEKPKYNGRNWYFDANQSLTVDSAISNMWITLPNLPATFDRSGTHKLKVLNNDPKLWHSQFRPMIFTWFNTAINFKLERYNYGPLNLVYQLYYDHADYSRAKIQYYRYSYDYDFENPYDLSTVINLDNTVAQMSSEKDTYNRYLIDNELKSLEIQKQQNSRAQAQSMLNAIGGILPTSIFDKPDSQLQYGVRTARGLLNFGFEYANQVDRQKQLELGYQMKMDRLKISTINISGSGTNLNRLDNSDKIKVWTGELSAEHQQYVDNYFHRYGYRTLEMRKIETLKKRKLWSHWKIIIDVADLSVFISESAALDLAERFRNGITLFHPYGANLEIDFNQNYENWEVWL